MPVTTPMFTFMADCLSESKRHDGEAEQPAGSNYGPYVCRCLMATTYRKCRAPWCAGHVTLTVQTVAARNGGPKFPCDSAAVETWDTVLSSMGYQWTGKLAALPPGAIVCQGGRHITFFDGWVSRAAIGTRYWGHGGNQANRVQRSLYQVTPDTRFYVIPDSWDKRPLPKPPRPVLEVLRNEDGQMVRVFHGRHLPTLLNRVRKALKDGATKIVVRPEKNG